MPADAALKRPGFGLPLETLPLLLDQSGQRTRFPHAIADFHATEGVTLREQRMLEFICQITDKPRWQEKVHDEAIIEKWRAEACGTALQQETSDRYLSQECFDFCVAELRDKAEYQQKHGVVHVLDVNATIVKTDLAQTDGLCDALRQAVKPLENVRDNLKDWHPGSDGLVLDLLHPSLFPLEYGQSRVLPDGKVDMSRCSEYTGRGETIPIPDAIAQDSDFSRKHSWGNETNLKPWGSFQWLPSEISFDSGVPSVDSYINNLHPQHHVELYTLLTTAVDKAVPLWNECLSFFHDRMRINVEGAGFDSFKDPSDYLSDDDDDDDDENGMDEGDRDYDDVYRKNSWLEDHPDERQLIQPSPGKPFMPFEERAAECGQRRLDLRTDFPDGLQVIFKLSNIHLTPEKPSYNGSNWHVEGALNEHICATALFYYDQENVSDSRLEFRQKVDAEAMVMKPAQFEYAAVEDMYGIKNEEAAVQDLGQVLTRPGRILAFPNVMQHRVRPFRLTDPSKPGHRKILAMFFVDPYIKILSTANVPPQRRDWWAEEVRKVDRFAALPVELFDRIIEEVDDFPVSWERACETREALMAERGRITDNYNEALEEDTFYFCEH